MKELKRIGFFVAFIIPSLVILGCYLGGGWNYMSIFFSLVVIPVVDQIVGLDTSNVSKIESTIISEKFYYRFVTYVWAFVQLSFLIWGVYVVSNNMLPTTFEWVGFCVGFSLVTGGIGITVAHELGHKKSRIERFCSKLLLMTVCYMHFYIEHNRGHHVAVATPEDPATARKDENFYAFWFKSVFAGYTHAWKLEKEKLKRNGKSVFSIQNEMIWFAFLPIVYCGLLTMAFSYPTGKIIWSIPIFFFFQSYLAISLLELVNYLEHYGIVRKQLATGKYERVNPLHSWNASHLISNFFLFQLQRHSDHHANAIKRYQVLDHYQESPQLPFGYPTMIIIALIPPLWFKIMNPRLKEWEDKVYKL